MSQRERQKYHLMQVVFDGRITLRDAGECMGISYPYAKRLKRRFQLHGAKGLMHGNSGRPSPNGLDHRLKKRSIELPQSRYANLNDTHFTEKLKEVEGITLSRETGRRLRRDCG